VALLQVSQREVRRMDTPQGIGLMTSDHKTITAGMTAENINFVPTSGRQERLENLINHYL
jgi:xylose isomerase